VTAATLVDAAGTLRDAAGAVPTPRQAADLAAVKALLGENGAPPDDAAPRADRPVVEQAMRALEEVERRDGTRAG
jgi:hypothetical protein